MAGSVTKTVKQESKLKDCLNKDCKEAVAYIDKIFNKAWCEEHKPPLEYVFK